jgi:chromosome segregation ATPase
MSSFQDMLAHVERMASAHKMFADAHAVLATFLNHEQVGKELEAANAAAREEIAKAKAELDLVRQTAATLTSHATALVAEAKDQAQAAHDAAGQAVAAINEEGRVKAAQTAEAQAAAEALLADTNEHVALATSELAEVNDKIAAARKAIQDMLGPKVAP